MPARQLDDGGVVRLHGHLGVHVAERGPVVEGPLIDAVARQVQEVEVRRLLLERAAGAQSRDESIADAGVQLA